MKMSAKPHVLAEVNVARLAAALPLERLHPAVRAWAKKSSPRAIWAVAFSGGADSLALLLLLWAHWPLRRDRLRALHFDHRLRGAASRGDAAFCRNVCAALGVTLMEGTWREAHRGASEAEARAARQVFFRKHSRWLWLGHQQDDIAETLLMRIARGSGSGGLAAPRPVQAMPGGRFHVRPLLTLKKKEIVAALRAAGIVWREDASNRSDDFFRNRVRRSVLPAWMKASARDALAGAALARELLEEEDVALERWLDEVDPVGRDGTLDLRKLEAKPRALVRRALHRWLGGQKRIGELARSGFERLLDAAMTGRDTRQSLGAQAFGVIKGGRLHLQRPRATE
jgi:tRNA(Ile)-lysidine synthase